jgi:hypothetical protein
VARFIMQSGLGHRAVWYMAVNVLQVHSGHVFTDSRKMEAVCPDRNLGTHQSRLHSPTRGKTIILSLKILHFPCIVSLLQNN